MIKAKVIIFGIISALGYSQSVVETFEFSPTRHQWNADQSELVLGYNNDFKEGINTSSKTLLYKDTGGQYANVSFDFDENLDLSSESSFSLKIYIPTNRLTGNQANQISLKLQNKDLNQPWTTQSEIIKPVILDSWQTITFNFATDSYINYDNNSNAPVNRNDFNRVLLQINGENNNDHVEAYIDDVTYDDKMYAQPPVYDNLIWSDEFETPGPVNASKWFHQTQLPNGSSWYNSEIQHYTNRTTNSVVENGYLKITAKKETFTDQGVTKGYTSARLNSKFAFTYGRVVIRAKLPSGIGTWPALWMLGQNINEPGAYWQTQGLGTTHWPECGEIDIMEHWGDNQNYVSSALHTPSSSGGTINHGGQIVEGVSLEFHDYELEWSPTKMVFKVDGNTHYTYKPEERNSDNWPFDSDQYLLFNIAIESSINQTSFDQSSMLIDFVRVYQESTMSTPTNTPIKKVNLYPNPVDDVLNYSIDHLGANSKISIMNTLGQELLSSISQETKGTFDVSQLPKGIYFARVVTSVGHYSKMFIKN